MRCLLPLLGAVAVGSAGCGEGASAADAAPPIDARPPALVTGFVAAENPANALSLFVEWETEPAAPTRLEVDCGADYQPVYAEPALKTEHRVFVMGLWDGASCELRAIAEADGFGTGEHVEVRAIGPLPEFLPPVTVEVHDAAAMQTGWTLVNLTNGFQNEPLKLALLNDAGRYRWYHELDVTNAGSDTDVRTVSEGVLIGGTREQIPPTILDWQGTAEWSALP